MGRPALFGRPMTNAELQARWRAGVKRKAAEQAKRAEGEPRMENGDLATNNLGSDTAQWTKHQERVLEALVRCAAVRADDGRLRFAAVEMEEEALQQALYAAVDALRAEDRALQ
jgi:hypothetical protein